DKGVVGYRQCRRLRLCHRRHPAGDAVDLHDYGEGAKNRRCEEGRRPTERTVERCARLSNRPMSRTSNAQTAPARYTAGERTEARIGPGKKESAALVTVRRAVSEVMGRVLNPPRTRVRRTDGVADHRVGPYRVPASEEGRHPQPQPVQPFG